MTMRTYPVIWDQEPIRSATKAESAKVAGFELVAYDVPANMDNRHREIGWELYGGTDDVVLAQGRSSNFDSAKAAAEQALASMVALSRGLVQ
jgi:hypothetical protein